MSKYKSKPAWYVDNNSKDEDIKAGIDMGKDNYANSQAAIDKEKWRENQYTIDKQKELDKKEQEEMDRIIEYGNEREDLGNKIREYENKEDLTEQDELELDRLKKRDIELLNNSPWYFDQRYKRYKERSGLKKELNAPVEMEDSEEEMSPKNYEEMVKKKLGYM